MAKIFSKQILIRFAHCDPAGIVFYPRYFEMFNEVVEDWFGSMDYSFADMKFKHDAGMPLANVTCDFKQPSRMGETLTFQLKVLTLGKSSIEIQLDALAQDQLKLSVNMVLVHIKHQGDSYGAAEIDERLREEIVKYRGTILEGQS